MEIVFLNVRNDQGARYEVDPSKPKGGSESYTDVWRLVALSGFPSIEIGALDLDNPNVIGIMFPANGNTKSAFLNRPRKCKLVHWNLEREIGDSIEYVDEVWVADKHYAFMANNSKVRHVPLGGHEALGGKAAREDLLYDFVTLSYDYGARLHNMNMTRDAGFTIAPNTFDLEARDEILSRSHYGLSLHQTPAPIIEPPRYVLFACWNLPIVAESVVDPFPYVVIPWDPKCLALLAMSNDTISKVAAHNYRMATGPYSFRNCVESGIKKMILASAIESLTRGEKA